MKFYKKGALLVCVLSLVVITACAKGQTQTESPKPAKTAATKETAEERIPPAARTMEEMVEQKAGVWVEKHMDQKLETLGGWDGQQYLNFLEKTFNPITEKELTAYFTEHKDLSG
jgi:hypothetical protein